MSAERVAIKNLKLIANLVDIGAGQGILPYPVAKAQRLNLLRLEGTPLIKDHLLLICYPAILKTPSLNLFFERLKFSYNPFNDP